MTKSWGKQNKLRPGWKKKKKKRKELLSPAQPPFTHAKIVWERNEPTLILT